MDKNRGSHIPPPMNAKIFSCGIFIFAFVMIAAQFPDPAESTFMPEFVWQSINKTLEEDRLTIVDANNEKIKVKWCTRVVLFNRGSENYIIGNFSGNVILVDTTLAKFSTPNVTAEVRKQMNAINLGVCIPCIVVISMVNVTSTLEERRYAESDAAKKQLSLEEWNSLETQMEDYKWGLSQEIEKLLQFRTPINARHLVLVRLVRTEEELTKYHGKRLTKYPTRLVPIWEQVLFDHFKEARVLQGAIEEGSIQTTLLSGKESGIWVWMCEEIVRRLKLSEMCQLHQGSMKDSECQKLEASNNLTTATIDMTFKDQCSTYRART